MNCGRFCFWRCQSVVFLYVYEISREPLNGFRPNSHGRRVWSLARTSLKVKGQGHQGQKMVHICCSQMAGWIKMPLGMEEGLGPGDFVLRGPSSLLPKKGAETLPNFRSMSIVAKLLDGSRWHLIGMEVGLGPGHFVLVGFPAIGERGTAAPLFSAHAYCGHGRQSQLLLSSCSRFFHRYKGN